MTNFDSHSSFEVYCDRSVESEGESVNYCNNEEVVTRKYVTQEVIFSKHASQAFILLASVLQGVNFSLSYYQEVPFAMVKAGTVTVVNSNISLIYKLRAAVSSSTRITSLLLAQLNCTVQNSTLNISL